MTMTYCQPCKKYKSKKEIDATSKERLKIVCHFEPKIYMQYEDMSKSHSITSYFELLYNIKINFREQDKVVPVNN